MPRRLLPVLMLLLLPNAATAQVTVSIDQGKAVTVRENGETVERIEAVDKVVPGDTVVYRYTIHNTDAKAASDVVVSATVPEHMTYAPGTADAEGWTVAVSHDGQTHAPEGQLVIVEIDETVRPAGAADIRYLRWTLTGMIPADSRRMVAFRATLDR